MATFIGICIVALFIKLAICSVIAIVGTVFYILELLVLLILNVFLKKKKRYLKEDNHFLSYCMWEMGQDILDGKF